ncbi:hypothetical protein BD626DRAFT_562706 [Schizophyllum amplum]|uniref:Uncharacterized protein n=1 Tax=Schizophyllum amplum TaxID=97359 RepID=A0A550CVR2_9AGAR|nr:hypothetical protein BD626DRAFT_562706 [Auriculariopsis ampla]
MASKCKGSKERAVAAQQLRQSRIDVNSTMADAVLCRLEQLLAEAGNSAYILSRALVDAEFAIAEGGGGHGPAEQRAGKTHVWVQAAEERAQIAQQHASAKGSRTARADNHAAESADRARDVDVRAEEAVVQASHADARALHAEEPASKEE